MKLRGIFVVCTALLVEGCGSYVNLQKSTPPPTATEAAIVVIGAGTASTLYFGMGNLVSADDWNPDTFGADRISGAPQGGYIVRQVADGNPDQRYGLTVLVSGGRRFQIRCGNLTPTLQISRGKVLYIADFDLGSPMAASSGLSVKRSFEAAQEFMRLNYPLLADKLEQGEFEWRRVSSSIPGNCSK